MMNVLIVEDEQPAARQLTRLLQQIDPEIRVLDTLDSVESAVRWLRSFSPPDLVFLDIQLADGLSFDIFTQVDIKAPVIFTTAFDQYAIQAFKVSAVDYLLKPIDPDDLEAALERVQQRASHPVNLDELARHFQPPSFKERFLVKVGQQFVFLLAEEIAFFQSSKGTTQAYSFEGKRHFVDHSLEELEGLLNPRDFFRISRNLIVRLQSIRKIAPHFHGRLKLEIHPAPQEEVFVSRDRASGFKAWLGG